MFTSDREKRSEAETVQVLQLSGLEILDVGKNRITTIPEDINRLASLKCLAMSRNRITRLPLSIGEMTCLNKLKFDENPLEFPPPEVYSLEQNSLITASEVQKESVVCAEVKKYLRECSKERVKTEVEGDMRFGLEKTARKGSRLMRTFSESNVETPRPPKRTLGGRFPVRPSISGIEPGELNVDHVSMPPPPIPQRSNARNSIYQNYPVSRRPGLAPLSAEGERNRSRSETVTSASSRSKRLGFLGRSDLVRKNVDSATTVTNTGTLKPKHFRGSSHASALHTVQTSSGGETSSGPGSPIDGPSTSRLMMPSRRLSSLPENRRASRTDNSIVKSARRIVFALYQLNRPVDDVIRVISTGSPKKSIVEKAHFAANTQVKELDRQLHRLDNRAEDEEGQEDLESLRDILKKSIQCLREYRNVSSELRLNARKMTKHGDPMFLRALMLQAYGCLIEVRNAVAIHEAQVRTPVKTPRASRAISSRSVTPTQAKPITNRRVRAGTILRPGKINTGSVPPPVPLIPGAVSRTSTMTSLSAVTPRSGESFSGLASAPMSRSNTMQSQANGVDEVREFEQIYSKLSKACDEASNVLPSCRMEFAMRKDGAARSMPVAITHQLNLVLSKCEGAINAMLALQDKLKMVKLKDPALRHHRDFWQLCDAFVRVRLSYLHTTPLPVPPGNLSNRSSTPADRKKQAWGDLALELRNIANQGHETSKLKISMRPAHKAVKEAGSAIHASPLYQRAHAAPIVTSPAYSASSSYIAQPGSSYASTPVPATPLSAALGPAALATVPSTPGLLPPAEYFAVERERSDTMGSRMYGRRDGVR